MDVAGDRRPERAKLWHAWFRKRLAERVPLDQIAHDVICSVTRENPEPWGSQRDVNEQLRVRTPEEYAHRKGLDLFWRRNDGSDPRFAGAEQVAESLLGTRVFCA